MMRIRITFSKDANLLYISVLDLQTILERSLRRAGLSIQYSQGFHPQPRIQIANPLPLGFVGCNELVDVWLSRDFTAEEISTALSAHLPTGMKIIAVEVLPEQSPSLPKQVTFSDYRVYFFDKSISKPELNEKAALMMAKETLPRVRNHKSYDLKPLIQSLEVSQSPDGSVEIHLRMPSSPGGTGRPEEVLLEMGYLIEDFRVERTALILSNQD